MCVYGVAPDITGRFVLFVFKKKKKGWTEFHHSV